MKVLWLANVPLGDDDTGSTGTWLGAMAKGLMDAGIELGIVSDGPVAHVTRRDAAGASQWLVPADAATDGDGLPAPRLVRDIADVQRAFAPDLIHVWGTEGYWGLLTGRGLLQAPALLEMQGLKLAIADVYYGGLSLAERLRCIGPKEILKRRTMHTDRRAFERWGEREREMVSSHRFVDVQSPWMAEQVKAMNPTAELFPVHRLLRNDIAASEPWTWTGSHVVFTSTAYPAPFKGLHVAIRALAHVRQEYPSARLRIAGPLQRPGLRQEGYVRWLNALARRLGVGDAVDWLGVLPGSAIASELRTASVALIPTYIESYCVAMAEAMHIGTPTVAAFTGGTSHLGRDGETTLFFAPGDDRACATQLARVLASREAAEALSRCGRATAMERHDPAALVRRQIGVYSRVLESASVQRI